MATPTVDDLLTEQTADQIKQQLLASLQSQGFPTTDWTDTDPDRQLVEMEALSLFDLGSSLIPIIVKGGFLDEATGDWLTLLAHEVFQVDRFGATQTTGTVTLSCNAASGPYTINARQLRILAASGNIYVNTSGGALASGGTLVVNVESEFANDTAAGLNYNDGANTLNKLATPLPGVTVNNPPPTFSSVVEEGSGTGTIALSATDGIAANVVAAAVVVTVFLSGQIAAAQVKYTVDGGAPIGPVAINAPVDIAGKDIRMTFANGAINPSFQAGDAYSFSAPGSWITQQGVDEETDDLVRVRCRAQWAALSLAPTDGLYVTWARQASNQVTKVLAEVDPGIAGRVNVYIAGTVGILPASVVNAVLSYIDKRKPLTEMVVVQNPSTAAILLTGTIYVEASKLAAAQAAAQQNVDSYINGAPIGGYAVGSSSGEIAWSEVLSAIGEIDGVRRIESLELNGNPIGTSISLTSHEIATHNEDLSVVLTWVTV